MRHAYGAFNKALEKLYGKQQLYLADTQLPFDFDPDIFEAASRVVYDAGGFDTELLKDQKVRDLIDETLRCLSQAIDNAIPVDVPDTLRYALENNAFVFSGFKTFHAMREVGLSMLTDDGNIKLWPQFRDDVRLLNEHYNTNYLYAEYKHAMGTAQMAVKWQQIEKDGDRYLLQYRTAGDDKVRDDHRLLDGTTLPPSDPFWASYYPPNGWGCRCTAVQVRRDKYPQSDPALAMKRGDNATDGVKQRIFRFNAGKTLQLFPPKHPYYKAPTAAKKAIMGYVPQVFDAKTVEQAEQLFRDKLGVTCSLKGFKKKHLAQVEDIFKCVDQHFQMHPELRDKIKFVGTSQGRQQLYEEAEFLRLKASLGGMISEDRLRRQAKANARRQCAAGANTYAYSAPYTGHGLNGLAFNASFQGEKVQESLASDQKSKWHPVGCDTLKSIFDHEFGHKIDEMLGLYTDPDYLKIYNEAKAKGEDYIRENLSRYAYNPPSFRKKNYDPRKEFLAEAWSEYLNNETPRPIAAAVGALIRKKYGAFKKT